MIEPMNVAAEPRPARDTGPQLEGAAALTGRREHDRRRRHRLAWTSPRQSCGSGGTQTEKAQPQRPRRWPRSRSARRSNGCGTCARRASGSIEVADAKLLKRRRPAPRGMASTSLVPLATFQIESVSIKRGTERFASIAPATTDSSWSSRWSPRPTPGRSKVCWPRWRRCASPTGPRVSSPTTWATSARSDSRRQP